MFFLGVLGHLLTKSWAQIVSLHSSHFFLLAFLIEPRLAKIRFDTAENEPPNVWCLTVTF